MPRSIIPIKTLATAQVLSLSRRRLDTMPGISKKVCNALREAKITTVGDVDNRRDDELARIWRIGKPTVAVIRNAITAERLRVNGPADTPSDQRKAA